MVIYSKPSELPEKEKKIPSEQQFSAENENALLMSEENSQTDRKATITQLTICNNKGMQKSISGSTHILKQI